MCKHRLSFINKASIFKVQSESATSICSDNVSGRPKFTAIPLAEPAGIIPRHISVPKMHFATKEIVPSPPATITLEILRSEEHTSELQSRENLVCRLLLEKKNI